MKNVNVLMVCDYRGPNPGHFIPSIRQLERYIKNSGENKVVYAFPAECSGFNWCKQIVNEHQKVYFYENKGFRYGIRFLSKIIHKEKITTIHTHFEPFDRSTLLVKLLFPKVKVVWHLHDDFTLGKKQKLTIMQRLKAFARDRLVPTIAVSPHIRTKHGYVLINHLAPDYIPDGTKYDIQRDNLRKQLGIMPNEIAILFFGWDKIRKGLDIACEMLTFLPYEVRKRCKLCIQVTKNAENERFVNEYCANPQQILWLKSTSDVYNYHMAADIMLSAARSETFAYTIMEALAVGTAVVSSDIQGVQWSKKYENIWFFESNSSVACARAVERCLKEFDEKKAVENAKTIRETLPIETWCKAIYDIYRT